MTTLVVSLSVAGYVAVMVGCWVKVAADYRYRVIRGKGEFSAKNEAFDEATLSAIWPVVVPFLIGRALSLKFVNAAGRLGERRAAQEDAAIEALKDQALALKRTRDLFDKGTDEWRLLDNAAVEARTKWQQAQW